MMSALLPLTPALSLRERQNCRQISASFVTRDNGHRRGAKDDGTESVSLTEAPRHFLGRDTLPPLPVGEGRGEGERSL